MAGDINIGNVTDGVAKIVGLFKKHPALAAEMENEEAERGLKRDVQQIMLNMVEATQGVFRGGWRPFIGWTCGVAIAYNYILQPFLIFGFTMAGFGEEVAQLPTLKIWEILPIVGGMLGLSINRSGDKRAGIGG